MIDIEQIKSEITRLFTDTNILIFYKKENLDSNPLHLSVNADMIISNMNIIKNLISLYINLMAQKGSKIKL